MHMPLTSLYLMRPKSEYEVYSIRRRTVSTERIRSMSIFTTHHCSSANRVAIIPAPVHRHNSENVFSSTASRQEQRRSFCGSAVHEPSPRLVAAFDRSWFPNSGVSGVILKAALPIRPSPLIAIAVMWSSHSSPFRRPEASSSTTSLSTSAWLCCSSAAL